MCRSRYSSWNSAVLAAAFVLLLAACGGGDSPDGGQGRGGAGGVPGSGGAGGSAGAGGDGGAGGSGGDPGCTNASDCSEGSVCDPSTGRCSQGSLACADSSECGDGGICSEEGECRANQTGGVCEADSDCPGRERCIGGYCGCMGERVEAEQVTPNVMILLDRSGSMDRSAGGSDTKWEIALRAIEGLLDEFENRIRFGLILYPEPGNQCSMDVIDVPITDDSGPAILDALANASPSGTTPTAATLQLAGSYEGLQDDARPNYVLLITDGDERCGGDGAAAATALRDLDREVQTFVVGFGDGIDPVELEAIALAGGTAQSGGPAYFQADDEASLNEAFATIGGMVLSCAYSVEDTGLALELDDIFVYFNDTPVAHDEPSGGWTYQQGASEIVFQGDSCRQLQTGGVSDLVIVHGCPVEID